MSIYKKIYLNANNIGCVTCKRCGKWIDFDLTGMDLSIEYRIRCLNCKRFFHVFFEARRNYRKCTDLAGYFYAQGDLRGTAKIVDISRSGIGFETTVEYPDINKGMHVRLEFRLDNLNRTEIMLAGSVINKNNRLVGIKVTDIREHIQKAIGFYLMP